MQKQSLSYQTSDTLNIEEVSITPDQYNNILNIQQEILGMLASHNNNSLEIINRLCILAETLLPNSVASIMILDTNTGLISVLAAPSIPNVGHLALKNLKPGPGGGSCGNAVFHNKAQYVQDTFKDSRWTDIRQIAYDFNLCSCWSAPVKGEDGNAMGTFALSSFEHRSPSLFHKKLLHTAASIISIVLKNQYYEKRLQLFSTAMQSAKEGMIITDEKNIIIEVNKAFEKIYLYKESDVIGKNLNIFSSGEYTPEFYQNIWDNVLSNKQWSGEIINERLDGTKIAQWMSISTIMNKELNTPSHFLIIFSDLTELKKSQKKVEEMSYRDTLTGLHNKQALEIKIDSSKKQILILLNVNNFSYINTAYGFDIGDKILIELAKVLKSECQTSFIARINSDEYALLFDSDINIKTKIQEIQEYFYTHQVSVNDILLNISFSYGACNKNENLFRNTALALKQAKENGKNRYYIYSHDDDSNAKQREGFISSNNQFHLALKEGRLVPYFQGIRNNVTKKITKYEVLARIEENGKVISPSLFLEPARLAGMLPEITKTMIDKGFQIMSSHTYTFSINITEEDLSLNYLINYLKEKAKEHSIEPSRVILEILEGISSSGKTNHAQQLKELKLLGYSIAIDDFGTEYSNFERVLDLEIDFLKIDAKYIKDIHTNKKSYEITRAIAFFAHNAKIPCIAEFVHNKEVQSIIDQLDIEFSQGYFFSKPAPLP